MQYMRLKTQDMFSRAYGHYAIAAFNVFNAEQVHGVFAGAEKAGIPVIIQITPAARRYMSPEFLESMIRAGETLYPKATVAVHLDHGDTEHCLSAIESRFYDSVMIDASHENFERNVSSTKAIVDRAHSRGIAVEAELGVLSGIEDEKNVGSQGARYTDPDQAVEFVERTGCDSLAVAVGTSHGAYKFKGDAALHSDTLRRLQDLLPRFPLVLHGASSVPQDEVERINNAGGRLNAGARGIGVSELQTAIRFGVTKVNVATDLRLIWTRVCREFFKETPDLFDPVVPGKRYMEEVSSVVAQKCQALVLEDHE
jgi:fructose-bisphosphate aldolase, class II